MSTASESRVMVYYLLRRFTRAAYRVRGIGLGRVCEALRRYASRRAPLTPLQINDFRGNAKFRCFIQEHMGGQIFFRGSYSMGQLCVLEKNLKDDSVFVDVGANQGEFSIAAARIVKRGKVIAFEPVMEYRQRLVENVKLNGFNNVVAIGTAVGEEKARTPIYDATDSFNDGTRHEGLPTLFASESRNNPREYVDVDRMDDVLSNLNIVDVQIIKLDIEGGEWAALRGARQTLQRCRPILIFEVGRDTCRAAGYEPESFIAWVESLGYRLESIRDDGSTSPLCASRFDFQNIVAYPL